MLTHDGNRADSDNDSDTGSEDSRRCEGRRASGATRREKGIHEGNGAGRTGDTGGRREDSEADRNVGAR